MRFSFFLSLLFPLSLCKIATAQQTITTYHKDSTIIISRDERLDQLVTKQKDQNTLKQSMPGYRVQIYFGSIRPMATNIKVEFSGKHPEVPSYLSYSAPNYKVRVGDFRTRLEAIKFLKTIEGQYATAFVIPDEIKLPPLK